jgi:hypothetical protein
LPKLYLLKIGLPIVDLLNLVARFASTAVFTAVFFAPATLLFATDRHRIFGWLRVMKGCEGMNAEVKAKFLRC